MELLYRKVCLGFLAWVLLSSFPVNAEVILGLPYEKMHTTDASGHDVTYYVTHPDHPALLVLFIQNQGCIPLFEQKADGHFTGELGVIMKKAAQDRVTLMAVERPYTVPRASIPADKDSTSVGCPFEYLEEDTLENRFQQIKAAIQAAKSLPWVKPGPVLVVGRMDGTILAGMLARSDTSITDLALANAEGAPAQWNFISQVVRDDHDAATTKAAIEHIDEAIAKINADGDSVNKWFFDFPYKYWASKFRACPIDDLLQSSARIYVMEGFSSSFYYTLSSELLITALQSRGHDVTIRRIERETSEPTEENIRYVTNEYARAIDWFLTNNGLMPPR